MEVPYRSGPAGGARAARAVGHAAHPFAPTDRRRPLRADAADSAGRDQRGRGHRIPPARDASGRPLVLVVTYGDANDRTRITAVVEAAQGPRTGPGRPRSGLSRVIGDKGYSPKAIRAWLRLRGIAPTARERACRIRERLRRGGCGGRPPPFDRQVRKRRNVVERCFIRLKGWHGIAARYDKTAGYRQAAVTVASLPTRV
ncbi:transposase [Streptomyces achromogenes]|uniref:transposase n=1 Tax=Streptomyces achromogenes TaxID=67255 RepID=UPI0036FC4B20